MIETLEQFLKETMIDNPGISSEYEMSAYLEGGELIASIRPLHPKDDGDHSILFRVVGNQFVIKEN